MTRILLRAPKDPFEVVDAEQTLEQNLIGDNAGNLVFIEAAHKLLSVPGVEIEVDRFKTHRRLAGRINERYDAYVIPLANAFRPSFTAQLERMTALIERLRIPVVVLGVGAQATLGYDWSRLAPMEASIRAFVRAVLDRGPSIGVRGELTHDYLRSLGFSDVEVVGCPSMFLWGEDLRVTKRLPALAPDSRVAITVSPYVAAMGPVVRRHVEAYPNLTYIAQDLASLQRLLWGESAEEAARTSDVPVHLSHPLYRDDKTRLFLDPWPWIAELRAQDFAFGTRIHGTIAALLAGTPGVVLAHDSRTLELARYFGIPHRKMTEVGPDVDAAELYAEADFAALGAGHAARFATFTGYLARHGLDHAFAHDGVAAAWDERMAGTPFPAAIRHAATFVAPSGPRARLRRARFEARAAARRSGLKRRPADALRRLRGPGGC